MSRSRRLKILGAAIGVALSASPLLAATPIAHWNFDYAPIGPDKTEYPDMVNQRNLTIENKTAVVPYDGNDAPFGKAITLTGQTGGFLSAPATVGPWFNKSFTVALWVKTVGDGKTSYLLSDWGPNMKTSFALGIDRKKGSSDDHVIADLRSPVVKQSKPKTPTAKPSSYHPSVVRVDAPQAVTANTWHHVAWVWDKTDATHGTMTVYLDGEQIDQTHNATGSGMTSVQVFTENAGFKVGYKEDTHSLFTGSLDEIWLYDDALTKGQVDNLMKTNDINKSAPDIAQTPPPTPTPTPTPVAVTPTPTPTPTPTVTPTPPPTPVVVVTPAPTPTPTPDVTPTPPPTPVPTPVAVSPTPTPTPTPEILPSVVRPVTAVPVAVVPQGYTPQRILGIISTALLACGLSAFLIWAKGERARMRGSRH